MINPSTEELLRSAMREAMGAVEVIPPGSIQLATVYVAHKLLARGGHGVKVCYRDLLLAPSHMITIGALIMNGCVVHHPDEPSGWDDIARQHSLHKGLDPVLAQWVESEVEGSEFFDIHCQELDLPYHFDATVEAILAQRQAKALHDSTHNARSKQGHRRSL